MATKADDIQAQLRVLKETYTEQLPVKFEEIEHYRTRILTDDNYSEEDVKTLHRLIHSLAGSGATFGFFDLSQQARAIEQVINAWLPMNKLTIENDSTTVSDMLTALYNLALVESTEETSVPTAVVMTQEPEPEVLIYLLEDDAVLAKQTAIQLSGFDYKVETFSYGGEIKAAIMKKEPSLIIADVTLPEGHAAGIDIICDIHEEINSKIPVIFTSIRDDFSVRLQAVRAGSESYFVKPINIDQLVDRLDKMTRQVIHDPYRILVIDDDATLAEHYALVLRQEGMEVSVCSQPTNVFHEISRCNPEFILMDVHMPECSGMELAKLIRQQDSYISIPIVFLSTENNINKQLAALGLGGDDFLNKPIQDKHLILSVTARVQRARQLSDLMSQDSLTGLLKHTHIKQQLETELLRAKRLGSPLSYVMIDIDHFKKVNDNYGHLTGDRVIKSLSRMLQHRLRKTDSIGRYGGEEFALVLPDTQIVNAQHIVEEIQKVFAEIKFFYKEQEFNVSLSAGIACYPSIDKAVDINMAADKALYKAKQLGRNRTVIDEVKK
ncbi:diguanylate cyclase/phosphodiesterase (GGDEF & EAL domains) with PAS/PAC sensor(s) [hydrothermal vent metagenome]|uniref:Diguanylate cyclase/phosphodiesterase (GGDEF & EAL domains) with PAS/PAC sensor(S) n=1 Tax=hydrothermal vent metagenome TaxID=652676 RepID=A0A3B0YXA0_9ZZZZ